MPGQSSEQEGPSVHSVRNAPPLAMDLGRENGGVFILDAEGCFETGNSASASILGWPETELTGEFFLKVFPEDLHDFILEKWGEIRRGTPSSYDAEIVTKDGIRKPIAVNMEGVQVAEHRRYLIAIREITTPDYRETSQADLKARLARQDMMLAQMGKQLERENRDAESLHEHFIKLSFAVECSPIGVALADSQGDIEYVNAHFCEMTGYSGSEARRLNLDDIRIKTGKPEGKTGSWDNALCGNGWRGEIQCQRKDGSLMWIDANISTIRSEDNIPIAYIAMLEDITEARKAREERKNLEERVQRYERLATIGQTVSNAAHCIKNLITVMNGGVHVLRHGVEQGAIDRVTEASAVLERATGRMSLIVQDMLDYSKPRTPEKIEIGLGGFLERILKSVKTSAEERDISLQVQMEDRLPPFHSDPFLFERILLNLILNSIDAMPYGGQLLLNIFQSRNYEHPAHPSRAVCSPMGFSVHEGHELIIQVIDEGIGIHPDELGRIFDPFYSSKGSRGTGLGLAAVEQNTMDLGGTIFVDSAPGQGTCFTLCFPVSAGRNS